MDGPWPRCSLCTARQRRAAGGTVDRGDGPCLQKAIEPLCQQRESQGWRVVVVRTTDVLSRDDIRTGEAAKLREHIQKLCREYKGSSSVLLVGAIESGGLPEPESKVVPILSGTAGRMKGQPSDNGYGCLDDGRLPAAAVGRFPARTQEEGAAWSPRPSNSSGRCVLARGGAV